MSFWEESSDLIKSKLVRKVEAASADETKRATIPGAVAAELPPQFGPVRKDRSRLLESSARSQAKKKVGRAALDKTNEGWGFPSVKSAETAEKKAKAKLKGDKEYDRLKKLTGIRPIRVGNKVTAGEAKPTRVIGGVSSGGDPTDDGSQSFVGALGESIMGVIKRPYKLGRKVGKVNALRGREKNVLLRKETRGSHAIMLQENILMGNQKKILEKLRHAQKHYMLSGKLYPEENVIPY